MSLPPRKCRPSHLQGSVLFPLPQLRFLLRKQILPGPGQEAAPLPSFPQSHTDRAHLAHPPAPSGLEATVSSSRHCCSCSRAPLRERPGTAGELLASVPAAPEPGLEYSRCSISAWRIRLTHLLGRPFWSWSKAYKELQERKGRASRGRRWGTTV